MASQTWATPGVYASERSSRLPSPTVERTSIFPPTCRSKTGSPACGWVGSGTVGVWHSASSCQGPDPPDDHCQDVVGGDGSEGPRVGASGRVVAEQPPARLAQLGGTTFGGALHRERTTRRTSDDEVARCGTPAVVDEQPVARSQPRSHRVTGDHREPPPRCRAPATGYRSSAARHAE